MSISQDEFLDKWRTEEPVYAAWGRFVGGHLSGAIRNSVSPTKLEMFLRLPVKVRTKEEDSLLQKAFRRGKKYKDPYGDIEDKVGLRFVVLLSDDIRIIEQEITRDDAPWNAVKARDFVEERAAQTYVFDYQSVHYVVRARTSLSFEGLIVPAEIPCEIQIRTLLQHAYSELTHDTIYKPSVVATPQLKRAAAKSMALIEATDDYFVEVSRFINKIEHDTERLETYLATKYDSAIRSTTAKSPLNSLLIDRYKSFLDDDFEAKINGWLNEKSYVIDNIRERFSSDVLYRVPAIILLYFAVAKSPTMAATDSPLPESDLLPIYSDLGIGLHGGA